MPRSDKSSSTSESSASTIIKLGTCGDCIIDSDDDNFKYPSDKESKEDDCHHNFSKEDETLSENCYGSDISQLEHHFTEGQIFEKILNRFIDRVFKLPQGNEAVTEILKEKFIETNKNAVDELVKNHLASRNNEKDDTLVINLKTLVQKFVASLESNVRKEINKIYREAIVEEVKKIPKTRKGLIAKAKDSKKQYANQEAQTPLKFFVQLKYNLLSGGPKPENFQADLIKALGKVTTGDTPASSIFHETLKKISVLLENEKELIKIFNNYEAEILQQESDSAKVSIMIEGCRKKNKPFFIVNCPMYVPVEEDNLIESSDDEIDGEFTEDNFRHPPFFVKSSTKAERGRLIRTSLPHAGTSSTQDVSACSQFFLEKLQDEGWDDDFDGNAFAVIGLNRPRSLSTSRNKALHREFNAKIESDFPHEIMAFFWDRVWYRKDNAINIHEVSYTEVRYFYKQLKSFDKAKANTFRRKQEGNCKIPYQDIRDKLRTSIEAEKIIGQIRKSAPEVKVYLHTVDSDTKSFNGIYSTYERYCANNNFPRVMSTGYVFSDDPKDYNDLPKNTLSVLTQLKLASVIDREIRIETAKLIPRGVYYPEPNTCILIPQDETKLPYTFLDFTTAGDEESAVLLRKIRDDSFVFLDARPLITALPLRSYSRSVSGIDFQFSEKLKKGGFPSSEDMRNLAEITQSHFYFNIWARNIEKNNGETVASCSIKQGILCDLFNYFKATILENQDNFTTNNKKITKQNLLDRLHENYSEDEVNTLYSSAENSMKRIKEILADQAKYFTSNTLYQKSNKIKFLQKTRSSTIDEYSKDSERKNIPNNHDIYASRNAFNRFDDPKYQYQDEDIRHIGTQIIKNLNRDDVVFVPPLGRGRGFESVDFQGVLKKYDQELISKKLIGVYNTGGGEGSLNGHWVTFCIIKKGNNIHISYKDSLGYERKDFEEDIQKVYKNAQKPKFYGGKEQIEKLKVSCGIFALKNMETLLDNSDEKKFFNAGASEEEYGKNIQDLRREYGILFAKAQWQYSNNMLKEMKASQAICDFHQPEVSALIKDIGDDNIQIDCKDVIRMTPSEHIVEKGEYRYFIRYSKENKEKLEVVLKRLFRIIEEEKDIGYYVYPKDIKDASAVNLNTQIQILNTENMVITGLNEAETRKEFFQTLIFNIDELKSKKYKDLLCEAELPFLDKNSNVSDDTSSMLGGENNEKAQEIINSGDVIVGVDTAICVTEYDSEDELDLRLLVEHFLGKEGKTRQNQGLIVYNNKDMDMEVNRDTKIIFGKKISDIQSDKQILHSVIIAKQYLVTLKYYNTDEIAIYNSGGKYYKTCKVNVLEKEINDLMKLDKQREKCHHLKHTAKLISDLALSREGESMVYVEQKSYWYKYNNIGLIKMLNFRMYGINFHEKIHVNDISYLENVSIASIHTLVQKLLQVECDNSIVLLPLNLYRKHWAGLVIQKENDHTIKIVYLDSSTPSLELGPMLIQKVSKLHPEYQVKFEILQVEEQRYNNCGPEVIENFILYLTGSRHSQEEAVKAHSQLYEQHLLANKDDVSVKENHAKEESIKYPTLYLGHKWIEDKITNAVTSTVSGALDIAISAANKIEELVKMCLPGEQPDWNIAQMLFYTDVLNFALESGGITVPFSRRPNSDPGPDDFGGYGGVDSGDRPNNDNNAFSGGLSGTNSTATDSTSYYEG